MQDLSRPDPVVDLSFTKLLLTGIAQLKDWSLLRIAGLAEVIEENRDTEILGQNAIFVFANVLWRQFHLGRVYEAIVCLDEGRIKHDSKEGLVCDAPVLEDDLDISVKGELHPLRFGQNECYRAFLAEVPPLGIVSVKKLRLEPVAVVHLEEGEHSLS